MSASGPGELTVIEERLTTQQYVQILQDVMLPSVRAMLIPEPQPIYIATDNTNPQLKTGGGRVQAASRGHQDPVATQITGPDAYRTLVGSNDEGMGRKSH